MITLKQTLICDDVRQEINGKLMLIGVYQGIVGVPSIPAGFPNGLTFFQNWETDRPGLVDMKVKIQHLETGQVLLEARVNIQIAKPGTAMLPIRLGPIQFNSFGTYNLATEIDGQKDPFIFDFGVQLFVPNQNPIGRP